MRVFHSMVICEKPPSKRCRIRSRLQPPALCTDTMALTGFVMKLIMYYRRIKHMVSHQKLNKNISNCWMSTESHLTWDSYHVSIESSETVTLWALNHIWPKAVTPLALSHIWPEAVTLWALSHIWPKTVTLWALSQIWPKTATLWALSHTWTESYPVSNESNLTRDSYPVSIESHLTQDNYPVSIE